MRLQHVERLGRDRRQPPGLDALRRDPVGTTQARGGELRSGLGRPQGTEDPGHRLGDLLVLRPPAGEVRQSGPSGRGLAFADWLMEAEPDALTDAGVDVETVLDAARRWEAELLPDLLDRIGGRTDTHTTTTADADHVDQAAAEMSSTDAERVADAVYADARHADAAADAAFVREIEAA